MDAVVRMDWDQVVDAAREVLAERGLIPAPDLWRALVERGALGHDTWTGFRHAVVNRQRRGTFPKLPRGTPGPARTRALPTPRERIDWIPVLGEAQALLKTHGTMTRPDLWRLMVERGILRPDSFNGFRAAMAAAQERGTFPPLPAARTGPARGAEWSDDRHAAQQMLNDLPTPWEIYTVRQQECIELLMELAGVVTVRLSPDSFAIFARQGYGSYLVRHGVYCLVTSGLARLRWDVVGYEKVPLVRAAA